MSEHFYVQWWLIELKLKQKKHLPNASTDGSEGHADWVEWNENHRAWRRFHWRSRVADMYRASYLERATARRLASARPDAHRLKYKEISMVWNKHTHDGWRKSELKLRSKVHSQECRNQGAGNGDFLFYRVPETSWLIFRGSSIYPVLSCSLWLNLFINNFVCYVSTRIYGFAN